MDGSLSAHGQSIPIAAMNFWGIESGTGTAFNSLWTGPNQDHVTPGGDTTVVVKNGVITYIDMNGGGYQVLDPNEVVIHARSGMRARVALMRVGDSATVDLSYVARHDSTFKFDNAIGHGVLNLTAGVNPAECSAAADAVRPRTALGWNETGQVWLITFSPQIDSEAGRNGYRTGGATVHQIGDWLKQLGATDAVSFDGGGSTVMIRNANGAIKRVDMADPDVYNQPWIRDLPILLSLGAR
jgi:exopolysaccharide biosynthesis protein